MPRLALLGILLSSSPALAAETAQLAVVGIHQSELTSADQKAAVASLIEAVEATGKANALSPGEVAGAIQGREEIILRQALLSEGNQALQNGKNLYNQALPDDAIPALETAIQAFERGVVGANTTKDLWEAYIYLGTSQLSLENEEAANTAFGAAAALNPARGPNPALFPPFVVEAFQAAKAALSAGKTSLVVTVDKSADIFLDGEKKTSRTIEGVLPGKHHVMARGEGTQAYQVVVVPAPVEGEEIAPVEVSLTLGVPSLGIAGESAASRSRQTAALYRTLGEHAQGVDLFLLAGVSDNLLHLQLYSPTADAFSKQVEIPYADKADDEAVQTVPLLLNVLDKAGHLPIAATIPTSAPLDIGVNTELAALLTQPRTPVVINNNGNGGTTKKNKTGLIVVGSIVVAGVLGGGGYGTYALLKPNEGPQGNTVIVGPL